MNLTKTLLVYKKELLDILRDRRTLMSMIIAPLLLFPVLILGVGALTASQIQKMEEKHYTVFVYGGEQAPRIVNALNGVETLDVEPFEDTEILRRLVQDGDVPAALIVPEGGLYEEGDAPKVTLLLNEGKERSEMVAGKIKNALRDLREEIALERVESLGGVEATLNPFEIEEENTATDEQMAGMILGTLIPYMLILIAMTGGLYPAIDLTAGEKERATIETILVTPVSRLDIVIGKFLTVMTASLLSGIISLFSMAIVFGVGMTTLLGNAENALDLSINPLSIVLGVAMIIPLTALFAAVLMTICIFAKSSREAQSYVTPLMFVIIIPAMMSMMPGFEPSAAQAWIPVMNVSLVMKQVLSGTMNWGLIGTTIGSTLLYAAAGIFVTTRVFQREEVLFKV
ncbi:ABC transporter permease subunit [bacterium]|nr:ABC transporter permease subunit [bacterium]